MSGISNLSEENDLNYANFVDRLQQELSRAQRYKRSFSLCLFSLDCAASDFKPFDSKAVLKEVSRIIIDESRIPDIVVSSSSEVLALIMPETPLPGAFTAADRIRRTINNIDFTKEIKESKLTVNMGIAAYPDHGEDADTLARAAFEAMELSRKREPNSISSASELQE